jgi:hypothetical protein
MGDILAAAVVGSALGNALLICTVWAFIRATKGGEEPAWFYWGASAAGVALFGVFLLGVVV